MKTLGLAEKQSLYEQADNVEEQGDLLPPEEIDQDEDEEDLPAPEQADLNSEQARQEADVTALYLPTWELFRS